MCEILSMMQWIDFKWQTDAFINTWSLVHLSWGIILGIILSFTRLSPILSFITAVILMIVWEIFEAKVGVGEDWVGVISDMIVGTLGFFIGYLVLTQYQSALFPILGAVVICMIVMEYLGWTSIL